MFLLWVYSSEERLITTCANLPLVVINSKSCLNKLWQHANIHTFPCGYAVNIHWDLVYENSKCPRVTPTITEKKVFAKSIELYQSLLGLCTSYVALIASSPAQTREHTYLIFDHPLYLLSINMPKSSLKNKTDLVGIKFQNQSFPYQSMNMLLFMNCAWLSVLLVKTWQD